MQNGENQNKNEEGEISSVRTYKTDVSNYIKKEGKSLADIAIAEESKRQDRLKTIKENKAKKAKIKKLLLKIGIIIIAIIVLIFVGLFIKHKIKPPLPENYTAITLPTPIKQIAKMTSENLKLGQFTFTELENTPGPIIAYLISKDGNLISLRRIFDSENIYPPGELVRAFGKNYGLGKALGGQFLITETTYYPNAISGMIKWEKNIKKDMFHLLNLNSKIPIRTASSTSPTNEIPGRFNDKTIANQAVRIFTEKTGTENLSYTIFNQKYLIIASKPETLQFVLDNLSPR